MSDYGDKICGEICDRCAAELPAAAFDPATLAAMILSLLVDRLSICNADPDIVQARMRKRSFWVRDAISKAARQARDQYGDGTDGQPLRLSDVQTVTEWTVDKAANAENKDFREMISEVKTNRPGHRLI